MNFKIATKNMSLRIPFEIEGKSLIMVGCFSLLGLIIFYWNQKNEKKMIEMYDYI